MKKLKVLELFAGISATSKALENLGIKHETTYVEHSKKVVEVKNKLWGTKEITSDVRKFSTTEKFNILIAGFPCQPFSLAGKQQGFNDEKGRGDLYLETLRIIRETKPDYVILENVKAITFEKHRWIIDEIEKELQEMGYFTNIQIINGKNYIPQNRERVFIMGSKKGVIKAITEKSHNLILRDFLEENVDEKYYLSNEKQIENILEYTNFIVYPRGSDGKLINGCFNRAWKSGSKYLGTITTSPPRILENEWVIRKDCELWFKKTDGSLRKLGYREKEKNWLLPLSNYYNTNIINDPRGKLSTLTTTPKQILETLIPLRIRTITPRESLRLMGWKDIDIDKIIDLPKSKLYFVAGNSMIVPVMEDVLKATLGIGEQNEN